MHKLIIKFFDFMRNCVHGFSVLILAFVMLIVLNWIETLIKSHWTWMDLFRPLVDSFTSFSCLLMDGSFTMIDVSFELKYFAAVILCTVILGICKVCMNGLNLLQEIYENGRMAVKKMKEDNLNQLLQSKQIEEQKQYRSYMIYVSLTKGTVDKFNLQAIDLDEQKNLMNKFLIENLGITPETFEDGFVYRFNKIDDMDSVLETFFKVLHSSAPVKYQICICLNEHNEAQDIAVLKKLISLNITNKICSLSNMAYRYRFLQKQGYNTSLLGVFNTENGSIEVHEFVESSMI